ncbi:phage terminase, small subunit, putative, P27 family [Loktanella fryxellensis]|uniref:Phage terminase, small subunit, putative, P27 family n=1 Tax=Loktanella fryxellensis TaxID=245187 RepID=A0A1H8IVS1_9RHOB|nr:phage terminase small subunit P27 family [Loktanella fryxellensis]SEN72572.1 phage terminase, small subunit, putative, P27 family [Loktanella fryxellensis]
MRGRKPKPTAIRRLEGNPGKRGWNAAEPVPREGCPECPDHLSDEARREWNRVADAMHAMGVLTIIDRAALAAYCQAYGRWVEAEQKLQETPLLIRTPSGYVQQSPWMSVSNKQLELMGRYMTELGMTPASRSRVRALVDDAAMDEPVTPIKIVLISSDAEGHEIECPLHEPDPPSREDDQQRRITRSDAIYVKDTSD